MYFGFNCVLLLVLFFPRAQADLLETQNALRERHENPVEAFTSRSYFYAGGQYVSNGNNGTVMRGQLYVEHLVPAAPRKQTYPLVFVHGLGQTGTNWLNTPDGREGWASYFLRQGYEVYIVDQPQRGRSAYIPGDGELEMFDTYDAQWQFTASQDYKRWPQAYLHTQWPGSGVRGDPIFDQFFASQVQSVSNETQVSILSQQAGAALLDRIGPAVLITHSQAGTLGFVIADARPNLVKYLISLEPTGPPFVNKIIDTDQKNPRPWGIANIPISYNPPVLDPSIDLQKTLVSPAAPNLTDCYKQVEPAKALANLAEVPMLVVTSESGFHAAYDYCTVNYLKQAGVNAEWLSLPTAGIHGNGHFIFMELNNLNTAALIEQKITRTLLN